MKILAKTDHETIGNTATLYRVVDEWYDEGIRNGYKPGSEMWTTMGLPHLVQCIRERWAAKTGLPEYLFPWVESFVALLATKKRKEADKPLMRQLERQKELVL